MNVWGILTACTISFILSAIYFNNKSNKQTDEIKNLKAHLIACKRILSWTVADIYRSRRVQDPQNDIPFLNAIQCEYLHTRYKEDLELELNMFDKPVGKYDFVKKEIVEIEID
jgi:hypothetical protein